MPLARIAYPMFLELETIVSTGSSLLIQQHDGSVILRRP